MAAAVVGEDNQFGNNNDGHKTPDDRKKFLRWLKGYLENPRFPYLIIKPNENNEAKPVSYFILFNPNKYSDHPEIKKLLEKLGRKKVTDIIPHDLDDEMIYICEWGLNRTGSPADGVTMKVVTTNIRYQCAQSVCIVGGSSYHDYNASAARGPESAMNQMIMILLANSKFVIKEIGFGVAFKQLPPFNGKEDEAFTKDFWKREFEFMTDDSKKKMSRFFIRDKDDITYEEEFIEHIIKALEYELKEKEIAIKLAQQSKALKNQAADLVKSIENDLDDL